MTSTDKDLSLTPLKGNSGKAYMGTYPNGDRVFVKMNTTPILAALAKEQIAPQLLWAKRLGNGDMMSAQEWLDGRILTKHDMNSKQIIKFLVICTALNTWLISSCSWIIILKILLIFYTSGRKMLPINCVRIVSFKMLLEI